ncbi:hypothetical protein Vi05172_g8810 [Venturia inaequalis]|nr:hypothetical protein Vi05172_g8810 [Venturia inaequalis]
MSPSPKPHNKPPPSAPPSPSPTASSSRTPSRTPSSSSQATLIPPSPKFNQTHTLHRKKSTFSLFRIARMQSQTLYTPLPPSENTTTPTTPDHPPQTSASFETEEGAFVPAYLQPRHKWSLASLVKGGSSVEGGDGEGRGRNRLRKERGLRV